jgi:SAM-dependent methyltransferase
VSDISETPFVGLGRSYMLTDHNGVAALQRMEYDRFADFLASQDGVHAVLDWGCGFGHTAHALAERGLEVTLYDFVPDLEAPRTVTLTTYPEFEAQISSDPVALPYADGAFDAVVSMGTLEHVEHPSRSLAELGRVLRPGGLLCVYKLPNRFSYVEQLAKRTGRYYHGKLEHDRVYRVRTARDLVRDAGYDVLEVRRANMMPLMSTSRRFDPKWHPTIDAASRTLARVPLVNLVATNVQVLARKPG